MTEDRLLLRVEEAAEMIGVSRARLYELLAAGEIASIKIGASRRVATSDLVRFVNRLRAEQGATTVPAPEPKAA
jgi:excisionase family DNA binding protein